MTASIMATEIAMQPAAAQLLEQTARSIQNPQSEPERPRPAAVVTALKTVETQTRRDRVQLSEGSLVGRWRLGVVSPKKSAQRDRGFYFPAFAPAYLTFLANEATGAIAQITNRVQVGPIFMEFSGPARWVGQRNLLAFDFLELAIGLGDRVVYRGPVRGERPATKALTQEPFNRRAIGYLPFFAFCWAGESGLAARGRSGGLALWVRDPDPTSLDRP
jgi:hypothetical protein